MSPPVKPWNPLHLDWSLQYIPSTNSVKDWSLGEIDYAPNSDSVPAMTDTEAGVLLQGRAHLTGGSAATAAASLRRAMDQALAAGGAANLAPNLTSRSHSMLAQTSLRAYAAMPASVQATITATGSATATGEIPPRRSRSSAGHSHYAFQHGRSHRRARQLHPRTARRLRS